MQECIDSSERSIPGNHLGSLCNVLRLGFFKNNFLLLEKNKIKSYQMWPYCKVLTTFKNAEMHLKEINKEKFEFAYAIDTEAEQPKSHILSQT